MIMKEFASPGNVKLSLISIVPRVSQTSLIPPNLRSTLACFTYENQASNYASVNSFDKRFIET